MYVLYIEKYMILYQFIIISMLHKYVYAHILVMVCLVCVFYIFVFESI